MEVKDILRRVDHTLLSQQASEAEMAELLTDGIKFNAASCCIPPSYVPFAVKYVNGEIPICTVIGFPNGYSLGEVKAFEAEKALSQGAKEIDMVINITDVKNGRFDCVKAEIELIKSVCKDNILKVIIETCLLTEEEKIQMCKIVTEAGADYIKTSTGFSAGGATLSDIKLFKANVGADVKIKAAGGIKSLEDAAAFIEAGADRLGTSRIVKLMKEA